MKQRRNRILLIAATALLLVAAVIAGVTLHDRAAAAPQATAEAAPTAQNEPAPTEAPTETDAPEESAAPDPSAEPETSAPPEASAAPKASDAPEGGESPAPAETPKAAETPAPTPEAKTVTVTIVCHTALASGKLPDAVRAVLPAGGVLLQRTVALEPGDTAWSVTQRACRDAHVSLEASFAAAQGAVYVEGIGNLYEFDCGQGSGWIYKVNGAAPGHGCDSQPLQAGDTLLWAYTCDYGNDV